MIERITVKNFQAHTETVLDLDKITVIVGPNDAGKSSLLRALRWVCLNTPRGSSFIQQGQDKASVEVTADGKKINRVKGKLANYYELDAEKLLANNGDAAKVPQTVSELLNVLPESFQGQHEGAFWLSLTGAEVSRKLNELVDLYLIDGVLSYLSTEVRSTELTKKVSKQLLEAAEKEVQDLYWVDECDAELRSLEGVQKELEEKQRQRDRLSELTRDAVQTSGDIATQGRLVDDLSLLVSEMQHVALKSKEIEGKKIKLSSLILDVVGTRDDIDSLTIEINKLKKKIKKLTKGKCPVCGGAFQIESRTETKA